MANVVPDDRLRKRKVAFGLVRKLLGIEEYLRVLGIELDRAPETPVVQVQVAWRTMLKAHEHGVLVLVACRLSSK